MNYPGGKNGSGVYQRLISMMPPHDIYVELFLGSGAVVRRKRPADVMSFGYELNPATIAEFAKHVPADWRPDYFGDPESTPDPDLFQFTDADGRPVLELQKGDAIAAVRNRFAASSAFWFMNDPARSLIYADPPYLRESRSSKGRIYQFEMFEKKEHVELLDLLAAAPCKVMISAYANSLYNRKLRHWRTEQIATTNRAGDRVIETVYLNFPEPFELHDYKHVGTDFRDRWRIEKRRRNWRRNWLAMPALERYAILGCIEDARKEYAAAEAIQSDQAAADTQRKAKRRDRQNRATPEKTLQDPATPKPALLFD